MKSILIAALLLSAIFSRGQDSTKKDSTLMFPDPSVWGIMYFSSGPNSHFLGTCWDKNRWEIKDTMGLIKQMKADLDRAYKEWGHLERLHMLARAALLKTPLHNTKEEYDKFNKALYKYFKETKKPL